MNILQTFVARVRFFVPSPVIKISLEFPIELFHKQFISEVINQKALERLSGLIMVKIPNSKKIMHFLIYFPELSKYGQLCVV